MSQPKRYDCTESWGMDECMAWMDERVDGRYVEYSDYAALAAENERLRSASFVTAVPSEEYERLKAENKRLRKIGFKMREMIGDHAWTLAWDAECKYSPFAAKEGRDAK